MTKQAKYEFDKYLDSEKVEAISTFSIDEIKTLVVDDKWMTQIEKSVKSEMERIIQRFTQRIKEQAERYETPMPLMTNEVKELEDKVNKHLIDMGFTF